MHSWAALYVKYVSDDTIFINSCCVVAALTNSRLIVHEACPRQRVPQYLLCGSPRNWSEKGTEKTTRINTEFCFCNSLNPDVTMIMSNIRSVWKVTGNIWGLQCFDGNLTLIRLPTENVRYNSHTTTMCGVINEMENVTVTCCFMLCGLRQISVTCKSQEQLRPRWERLKNLHLSFY